MGLMSDTRSLPNPPPAIDPELRTRPRPSEQSRDPSSRAATIRKRPMDRMFDKRPLPHPPPAIDPELRTRPRPSEQSRDH
jgi:hypothetical protein